MHTVKVLLSQEEDEFALTFLAAEECEGSPRLALTREDSPCRVREIL